MAKKQGKQNQKRLVVNLRYEAASEGDARLSRAIDILLRSGVRAQKESMNTKKEEPPRQVPTEDTLTSGSEEDESHE